MLAGSEAPRDEVAGSAPRARQARGAAPPSTLTRRKLRRPSIRGPALARPELVAKLAQGVAPGSVTTVHAPAGWGKSRLVAEWVSSIDESAEGTVAWLTLDAGDAVAEVFWAYLATALAPSLPPLAGFADDLVPRRGTGGGARDLTRRAVTEISNAFDEVTHPLILVLDGCEHVRDPVARAGVSELLEHLPTRSGRSSRPARDFRSRGSAPTGGCPTWSAKTSASIPTTSRRSPGSWASS